MIDRNAVLHCPTVLVDNPKRALKLLEDKKMWWMFGSATVKLGSKRQHDLHFFP